MARDVAIVTGLVAAVGVAVHVCRNYEAAPLDFGYIAPSALAFIWVCLFLATLGHPALERAVAAGNRAD